MAKLESAVQKLRRILTHRERARFIVLLALGYFGVIAELAGVALLLPFLTLTGSPDLVRTHPLLSQIYYWSGLKSFNEFVTLVGLLVFVFLALGNIYSATYFWLVQRYQSTVQVGLCSRLLETYLSRSFAYHLREGSSKAGSRVLSEAALVSSGIVVPLLRLNSRVAIGAAIVIGILFVDPVIAFASFVLFGGIYTVVYLTVRRKLRALAMVRNQAARLNYKFVVETFASIREVKLFHCEQWAIDRVRIQSARSAGAGAQQVAVAELPRYVIESTAFGCVIFITLYLVYRKVDLQGVLPVLGVFTIASYRLISALQQCFASLAMIQGCMPALNNVHDDLFAHAIQKRQVLCEVAPMRVKHDIALEDITFAYCEGETPVFKEFSLTIKARTVMGVVGTTGAGKSTLANILLGLLEPQVGRLSVDGVAIDSDNVRDWQRGVGYVPQEIVIMDDTVVRNVAFGVPELEVDLEAVKAACMLARLHDYIEQELPGGYSALLGERGARLSGGQRQRIGIARALYRKPSVLVFDEATSALDTHTEKMVMDAIQNLATTMTIVIIAHRLSTLTIADQVVLLENGRVVSQGSYEKVIADFGITSVRGIESGV